ncbi:unnamed protein product [Amoebophrya sp. A120]|nr:unnamed protein product [Amoebophrya sp. A120]|eukprot:GSA120T00012598001.1
MSRRTGPVRPAQPPGRAERALFSRVLRELQVLKADAVESADGSVTTSSGVEVLFDDPYAINAVQCRDGGKHKNPVDGRQELQAENVETVPACVDLEQQYGSLLPPFSIYEMNGNSYVLNTSSADSNLRERHTIYDLKQFMMAFLEKNCTGPLVVRGEKIFDDQTLLVDVVVHRVDEVFTTSLRGEGGAHNKPRRHYRTDHYAGGTNYCLTSDTTSARTSDSTRDDHPSSSSSSANTYSEQTSSTSVEHDHLQEQGLVEDGAAFGKNRTRSGNKHEPEMNIQQKHDGEDMLQRPVRVPQREAEFFAASVDFYDVETSGVDEEDEEEFSDDMDEHDAPSEQEDPETTDDQGKNFLYYISGRKLHSLFPEHEIFVDQATLEFQRRKVLEGRGRKSRERERFPGRRTV